MSSWTTGTLQLGRTSGLVNLLDLRSTPLSASSRVSVWKLSVRAGRGIISHTSAATAAEGLLPSPPQRSGWRCHGLLLVSCCSPAEIARRSCRWRFSWQLRQQLETMTSHQQSFVTAVRMSPRGHSSDQTTGTFTWTSPTPIKPVYSRPCVPGLSSRVCLTPLHFLCPFAGHMIDLNQQRERTTFKTEGIVGVSFK